MKTMEKAFVDGVYSSPYVGMLEIGTENGFCLSGGSGRADPLTESNDWGNIFNGE